VTQLTEEVPKSEPNAREFQMSKQHFTVIIEEIYKYSGIVLKDIKEDMVYNRISRRVRKTGSHGFDDYLAMALQQESVEFTHFVNAITTNFTSFFREFHHFDFIKNTAIPEWKSNLHRKKLRIWSAGSSTGEEAYSIAMTLNDQIPNAWDTKILATDLDTNVVAQGESGIYSPDRVGDLSSTLVSQYFDKIGSGEKERVQVKKSLRDMTFFKPLNLLQDWPMSGQFEMIFCRNVVIYFDKPTQKLLFNRFADLLSPGGYLIIGHAESMYNLSDRFTSIGNTVYRKTK
jgi:chemotaxis protein methyltransferase CheR